MTECASRNSAKLDWTEYKTVRQYQSMGDMLDEFKVYGYSVGVERILQSDSSDDKRNGHDWLTIDPSA